jgi:hypothetical protein
MSRLRCAHLHFPLARLPVRLRSLLGRGASSFFYALLCSTLTDFHVQLSYRCLPSARGSFFSSIALALNSKSASSALLRSASSNSD